MSLPTCWHQGPARATHDTHEELPLYYEQEIALLGDSMERFERDHRKIARRPGLSGGRSEDLHVQRMMHASRRSSSCQKTQDRNPACPVPLETDADRTAIRSNSK
ncbi:type VI secretion system baseplate subunit TssF [Paraburkholderia acidicola]|uniref:type VI secretion system baseplate subunit TssF n=1 Tax=Paraburkholderia acidicola TaxID=1912599 RepID=UPI003D7FF053